MSSGNSFWDSRAEGYDDHVTGIYDEAYKKTLGITERYLSQDQVVIDYGCGTGITTIPLSEKVSHIHAIDISSEMVAVAEQKCTRLGISNITFNAGDLFIPALEGLTVDVIMVFNVFLFIEDIEPVMRRIYELLKPGGLFLSVTDCDGEGKSEEQMKKDRTAYADRGLYIEQFTTESLHKLILGSGFEILYEENLFDDPPNYYIAARKAPIV